MFWNVLFLPSSMFGNFLNLLTSYTARLTPAIRAGKGWRGRRELAPRCSAPNKLHVGTSLDRHTVSLSHLHHNHHNHHTTQQHTTTHTTHTQPHNNHTTTTQQPHNNHTTTNTRTQQQYSELDSLEMLRLFGNSHHQQQHTTKTNTHTNDNNTPTTNNNIPTPTTNQPTNQKIYAQGAASSSHSP